MRVLVTGGTGSLGQALVRGVAGAGHGARVMSRRARSALLAEDFEWAQADIATGDGVRAAVEGA
ncbi:MAG TPA: NAD-dependent epimerase/dehydratase family protein, partial [Pyrinomonadaceae bacterium]|nr:NAD-dependent epimerase/dehydratase family protein [Pyrinomonadaceae bacterium]